MSESRVLASVSPKLSAPFQVPLSRLVIDPQSNVRSASSVSADGIEQMAAMLKGVGQLNPLVVSKCGDGTFTVHAGGRRTRGFWLLRDRGELADDHLVDVREVAADEGLDLSMVENLSQEPMHPVDEFLGYQRLSERGHSPEAVAKAYGVSLLHVKRRMKLAQVHPKLLAMFRKGEIHLDQIMALASCDDPERQLQVWKSLPAWNRSDQVIRRIVTEDEVSIKDPRVKVVGLDAYLAAGGAVRQDLFSDKADEQRLTDPGLLEMLVGERLEAKASKLRSEGGWAWVEILEAYGHEERRLFQPYPVMLLPETEEQQARREAIEADLQAKEQEALDLEDGDELGADAAERLGQLRAQMSCLLGQVAAIADERVDPAGVDRAMAGAIVYLEGGSIKVCKPMIRAEDLKKLRQSKPAQGAARRPPDGGGASIDEVDDGREDGSEGLSDRLMMNLSAQRTAALQAELIANERVCLAALAAHLAALEFDTCYYEGPVKVSRSAQAHTLRGASPTYEGSSAQAAMLAERDAIAQLLPAQAAQYLGFFLGQALAVSLRVISFCTAISLNGVRGKNSTADPLAPLAGAVSLDMRKWWEPTSQNYLSFVPKAKMIEAVVEAKGAAAVAGWDKLKKGEVLERSEATLRGAGWLPLMLR